MPLYIPVDFNSAYSANKNGQLVDDQVKAITFMLKARGMTGALLFFLDLPMVALFGGVALAGDWGNQFAAQLVFAGFAVGAFAGVVYGWKIWQTAKKAKQTISSISVEKVTGEAIKYNYGVPVKVMGVTHAVLMKHGYVRIGGQKYGVLNPQLYAEISENKKTDFYIVPIASTGFSKNGVVVNCSN